MRRRPWPAALLLGASALLAAAAVPAAPHLTSARALADLRSAAEEGDTAADALRERLLRDARRDWRWGSVSGEFVTSGPSEAKTCHPADDPQATEYLTEGASDAYAQALGAHLADDDGLGARARSHVLDLVDTRGFRGLDGAYGGSNQCILELAISTAIWIETAALLEGTPAWGPADRTAFQTWLAGEVYPKVAWASRARSNNWGVAGSLAAWAIARYVAGAVPLLEEQEPEPRRLEPEAAAAAHGALQHARLSGELAGDAHCPERGIQPGGGIPEELRRGATGCDGRHLVADDASLAYQTMHVQLLVLHAELLRRDGDPSLYTAESAPGAPAILQAILFVIDNPDPEGRSWPWPDARLGTLVVASGFYDHPALADAADGGETFRGGRLLPYARVTHGPEMASSRRTLGAPGKPVYVEGP